MLDALARSALRWPRLIVSITLVIVGAAVYFGIGVESHLLEGGLDDPNSESGRAAQILQEQFPNARSNLVLLVKAPADVDTEQVAAAGQALADRLDREGEVTGVVTYWQTRSPSMRSTDGRSALIAARIDGNESATVRTFAKLAPAYQGEQAGNLEVSLGGRAAFMDARQRVARADMLRAETIALPATLVILVLVFGSFVAASIPLAIGIISIMCTDAVLRGLTEVTEVSVYAQNLTTALGLGLAIDYALIVVRRFREELDNGYEPPDALRRTMRTAGRTVLFSAVTVAVALGAMIVFPIYFLRSFAYAGISVTIFAAAAALIIVPALLSLLGRRINAGNPRRLWRRAPSARHVATTAGWSRLVNWIGRVAPLVTIAVVALLLWLGTPFLQVTFGTIDDRQLPRSEAVRVVHDTIRSDFDGSTTATLDILLRDAGNAALNSYAQRLSALPDVAWVISPTGAYTDGAQVAPPTVAEALRTNAGVAHLSVVPIGNDTDPETQDLVRAIRTTDAPTPVLVSGRAADLIDSRKAIGDKLPLAAGIVVGSTLIVMFLLTGSVLMPIKTIITNGLGLTVMFGFMVWTFEDGHLSRVLDFTPTGYTETSLPILMFCIAFGLSMDYGVFLMSRIKEEWDKHGDNRRAVTVGLARTASMITAAAIILGLVLGAFGTSNLVNVKMVGVGVTLAILVDATIIRCLLVPAIMLMLGRANWWAPAPLRWLHARIGLSESLPDGHGPAADPAGQPAPGHSPLDRPAPARHSAGHPALLHSSGGHPALTQPSTGHPLAPDPAAATRR